MLQEDHLGGNNSFKRLSKHKKWSNEIQTILFHVGTVDRESAASMFAISTVKTNCGNPNLKILILCCQITDKLYCSNLAAKYTATITRGNIAANYCQKANLHTKKTNAAILPLLIAVIVQQTIAAIVQQTIARKLICI